MTFDQLRGQVLDYCNLTSTEAQTRVGKAINRHYRRVTSLLGMETARFVTRSQSTTAGVRTVTFEDIEKIDRVIDATTATAIRVLPEQSLNHLRTLQPGTAEPTQWALQNTDADSVTIILDTVPQTAYSLQADGWTTLSDLSGASEPAFPESFHDILAWFVISEELLKKEKLKEAAAYDAKAKELVADLRFHLADSHSKDLRQGGAQSSAFAAGSSGSGGGTTGGTAYTQSALLTFDRGVLLAPFAVAQSTAALVTNLDADKLDGSHLSEVLTAATIAAAADIIPVSLSSEVTGRLPYANLVAATNANVLVGRRSGTAGDLEEITLSGLSMVGQVLTATPTLPSGAADEVQFRDGGVFGSDTAFTFNKATNRLTTDLITLTGGQLVFPATQNPSSNANTLDDYEEGTWTPVIGGETSQSGQSYGAQIGNYVKVGKWVLCSFFVLLSTKGTITGNVMLKGLPFTAEATSDGWAPIGRYASLATSWISVNLGVDTGGTAAFVFGATAAGPDNGTQLTAADISNTTELRGQFWYRATT